MKDFVYIGTNVQVGAANTAALLRKWRAIWCPPPNLRPWHVQQHPVPGDRLWLCWMPDTDATTLHVLGGGYIEAAPRQLFDTVLLWTNLDLPGVAPAARALGYEGSNNMSFLRLQQDGLNVLNEPFPQNPRHGYASGLSDLTAPLLAELQQACPIA